MQRPKLHGGGGETGIVKFIASHTQKLMVGRRGEGGEKERRREGERMSEGRGGREERGGEDEEGE